MLTGSLRIYKVLGVLKEAFLTKRKISFFHKEIPRLSLGGKISHFPFASLWASTLNKLRDSRGLSRLPSIDWQ